jgi:hypothetical protein
MRDDFSRSAPLKIPVPIARRGWRGKTVTVAPRPRIDKFIRLEYPAATLPGQPSWMN